MSTIRCLALALAASTLLMTGARADEAADRHAAAIDLLGKMHITDNMSHLGATLVDQVRMAVTHGDPDLMKQYDGFAPHLREEVDTERTALVDQIADIYAGAFSADELKQMAAFYETPLGQKIVATQIGISGKIIALTQSWGGRVSTKLIDEARVNFQNAQ